MMCGYLSDIRGKMRVRTIAIFGCALFVAACDGAVIPPRASTDVYDFRLQSDTFHIFHWPQGSAVRVYVNRGLDAAASDSLSNAFDRGAAQWNAYATMGEYHLVRAASLADADVALVLSNEISPVNTSSCEPVLTSGVTTFCLEDPNAAVLHLLPFPPLPPGDTTARNIKMVVTILSSQLLIPGRVDRLVAHELGHVLGIGRHSPDPNDLMTAGVPPRATLSSRDIATVQVLYHTVPDILP